MRELVCEENLGQAPAVLACSNSNVQSVRINMRMMRENQNPSGRLVVVKGGKSCPSMSLK